MAVSPKYTQGNKSVSNEKHYAISPLDAASFDLVYTLPELLNSKSLITLIFNVKKNYKKTIDKLLAWVYNKDS